MKTLSQLQEEAVERFEEKFKDSFTYGVIDTWERAMPIQDFLKTELTQIVKESFKNTRVEEKHCRFGCYCKTCALCDENTFIHCGDCVMGKPLTALSDKHNKECEFLGN